MLQSRIGFIYFRKKKHNSSFKVIPELRLVNFTQYLCMYMYKNLKKGLFEGKLYFLSSINVLPLAGSSSLLGFPVIMFATLMECIIQTLWRCSYMSTAGIKGKRKKFLCKDLKKDLKEWMLALF